MLLCQLTGGSPAFLGVGGGQLDTEPLFLNFKGKAALLVIVGLLAEIGVLAGVFSQPIFEVGVVSHDLGNIAFFVKKDGRRFLLLGKTCFHKIPPIFMNFCRLYTGNALTLHIPLFVPFDFSVGLLFNQFRFVAENVLDECFDLLGCPFESSQKIFCLFFQLLIFAAPF